MAITLIKKQSKSETSSQIELTLNEKDKVEGIAVMSFSSVSRITMEQTVTLLLLDYTAGQFAFFDIGGVYNDPKGPDYYW